MITPHIAAEILSKPLLVTPDKLHAILSVINRKNEGHFELDIAALAPYLGADKNGGAMKAEARPVRQAGGEKRVAVISVIGSLATRNHGFDDGSGLRSYRTIAYEIDQAMADAGVVGIVLDIDSYGGAAAGCSRLASHIKEASKIKPIYANIDLNCFSAACWIASACNKIYLSDAEDAGMGSIGCLAIHRDVSGKNEKDGEVYTAVYFGARKNDFSPHQPLSDDLHKKMQAGVDRMGHAFAVAIAENRGLTLDDVLGMQASCYSGTDIIKCGLADGVASFSETVELVAEDAERRSKTNQHGQQLSPAFNQKEGATMSVLEKLSAILGEEGAVQALAELGYVSAETAKKDQEAALTAQKENYSNVVDLAVLAEANALQIKTVLAGEDLSSKAISAQLQTMRADSSKKNLTSTISATSGDGKHGLIAAAEKMAQTA